MEFYESILYNISNITKINVFAISITDTYALLGHDLYHYLKTIRSYGRYLLSGFNCETVSHE